MFIYILKFLNEYKEKLLMRDCLKFGFKFILFFKLVFMYLVLIGNVRINNFCLVVDCVWGL